MLEAEQRTSKSLRAVHNLSNAAGNVSHHINVWEKFNNNQPLKAYFNGRQVNANKWKWSNNNILKYFV